MGKARNRTGTAWCNSGSEVVDNQGNRCVREPKVVQKWFPFLYGRRWRTQGVGSARDAKAGKEICFSRIPSDRCGWLGIASGGADRDQSGAHRSNGDALTKGLWLARCSFPRRGGFWPCQPYRPCQGNVFRGLVHFCEPYRGRTGAVPPYRGARSPRANVQRSTSNASPASPRQRAV